MIYKYWKAKNTPSKGTIVFIHGFAITSDYFDSIASKLNEHYDYYALELPGMGRTEVKNKKDLYPFKFAKMISEWIKEKELENIILIGHSMGGGTVNIIGTLIPERIQKIISITPMSSVITSLLMKNSKNIIQYTTKKAYKKANIIAKYVDLKYPNKENDQRLIEEVKYNNENKKNFKILYKHLTSIHNNIMKLYKAEKNISVPTLLITAEHDNIIHSKKTAKRLTKNHNVKWVEIKDSGHVPFEEQEKETLNTILDFLNE